MFKGLGLWKQARHEIDIALALAEETGAEEEAASLQHNLAILLLKSGQVYEVPALLDKAGQVFAKAGREAWSL